MMSAAHTEQADNRSLLLLVDLYSWALYATAQNKNSLSTNYKLKR